MTKKCQKGFGVVEILIVIIVVGLIGSAGWFVLNKQNDNKNTSVETSQEQQNDNTETPASSTNKSDASSKYVEIAEWGVRFTIPENLEDVEYILSDENTVGFFAKPKGTKLKYRDDYKTVSQENNQPKYAKGIVYRSSEASKDVMGLTLVEGKKIGDYYYYTAHAFSSLSTGAGYSGIFFDSECDQDVTSNTKCDEYIEAENKTFENINTSDSALLNTIELVN